MSRRLFSDVAAKANFDEKKMITRVDAQAIISAWVVGLITKKRYRINPVKNLSLYRCLPLGNDPAGMGFDYPQRSESKSQPIAVIGTSGLRVVELALDLQKNTLRYPKIYLVDSSQSVHVFWEKIRDAVQQSNNFEHLRLLIMDNVYSSVPMSIYLSLTRGMSLPKELDVIHYVKGLCDRYGFDNMKRVIQGVVLIRGDWRDRFLFNKLRNITAAIGLTDRYVYASNITACISPCCAYDVINNINQLCPIQTIHTDLCDVHHMPERVFKYAGEMNADDVMYDLGRAGVSQILAVVWAVITVAVIVGTIMSHMTESTGSLTEPAYCGI